MTARASLPERIREADRRIRPHARETPLLWSPSLSDLVGGQVWLKLENLQHTGSFKLRGALNRLLTLSPADRERGVVTASTGNHGAATAYAGRLAGVTPVVWVPHGANASKLDRIVRLGGKVEVHGTDSGQTEIHAREVANRSGRFFLSPYNDWEVVAGQGTIGAELMRQCPAVNVVIVSVGGGGLISGIASALSAAGRDIEVIGCSPENSQVMAASVSAGAILDLPSEPTLSDGTAGGVEPGALTFELCRDLVSRYDLVTEADIADAMRLVYRDEGLVIEGAAGVAVASLLRNGGRLAGKNVVVVICGGNIGARQWLDVIEGSS